MNQLLTIYAIYFLVAAIASLLWYWLHRSSEVRKARDEARRAQDDTADAQLALCCELAKPKWRQDRACGNVGLMKMICRKAHAGFCLRGWGSRAHT